MIAESISKLRAGADLKYGEAYNAVSELLGGTIPEGQVCDFLRGLAEKGETDDELMAMLECMQERAVRLDDKTHSAMDVCGTGGDGASTFNVSTAVAFVAAAAGCRVAKHGNRSSRGGTGSADILECLGYDLFQSPQESSAMLDRFGICFMFAQKYHPAMRHVASARQKLGRRTAFNMLGPLSNPAGVRRQLVGVSSDDLLERLPTLLHRRGSETVMTVRSEDGLDEFSPASKNKTCLLIDGAITSHVVDPASFGMRDCSLAEIQVNTPDQALRAFVSVLKGEANHSMTDTVALNAGAAILVGGITRDLAEGVDAASDVLSCGRAFRLLEELISDMGGADRFREVHESCTS